MDERETGEGRQTEAQTRQGARGGRQDQFGQDDRGAMTRSGGSGVERDEDRWQERDAGGGWSGYVVPYRYYGPGYRGVGYYSVMYQGSGDREAEEGPGQTEQTGSRSGQGQGWSEARGEGRWADRGGRGMGERGRWSGGFAGRGPKGYQRSDERLREEVSDRLMADDRIDASEIEVQVRDGEVVLSGTVDDRWAKRRAEDLAEQVMGVRDVMNQIRVQSGSEMATGRRQSSGPRQGSTSGSTTSSEERSAAGNGRRKSTSTSR